MFDPSPRPRVFGLPPGADFPKALVEGLLGRLSGESPDALARVQLIVNTRRMARRIRRLFDEGGPALLPRIQLLSDLEEGAGAERPPAPVPPLRRRLELVQLVSSLLDAEPELAPRSSLYDLADSLVGLMDEMHGEGVNPEVLARLDVSDQSGHWARAQRFLMIVQRYFGDNAEAPDAEARHRLIVENMVERWQATPPSHPVIIAGSTGSRGATALLMEAIARLPQGAVILPGFDFAMPGEVWQKLDETMVAEDHPQFRFRSLMRALEMSAQEIRLWQNDPGPDTARNRLVSLALRPAPVTDQWLSEGPELQGIAQATAPMTLLQAPGQREEALAIAMRLRQSVEEGQVAALITPDRVLTRQVTAALDRWGITPDDSAGTPLQLTPPGRFLRHVADLFLRPLTAEMLLSLLKHPLTHSGEARNLHLLRTRDLELHLRRHGPPFPDADSLRRWAQELPDETRAWAEWLAQNVAGQDNPGVMRLEERVEHHLSLATAIAAGPAGGDAGELWQQKTGREASRVMKEIASEAPYGGQMSAADYADLLGAILSRSELREIENAHPQVLIWGTLEARVQGAELLILGGLNEGSWPEAPSADPWLNRTLRHEAGLLLPDRKIGLAAHDFQIGRGCAEVWLTRSVRSSDAETVPSRWLNRIMNLMKGLPEQGGSAALQAMQARGDAWLVRVKQLEEPGWTQPARRPSPCPPVSTRPGKLSVTEIKRLIRDPYAIYARHVLRLRPLDPLDRPPDALLRGIIVHEVLEDFVRQAVADRSNLNSQVLMAKTQEVLQKSAPWAAIRELWAARMARSADWFLQSEFARLAIAEPVGFELAASARLSGLDFELTAQADRIDRDRDGVLHIYDYKTGSVPTVKQQKHFDKQLLLEAALAEQGAFSGLDPAQVARAVYIGLGAKPSELEAPLEDQPPGQVWAEFTALIGAYFDKNQGSRRGGRC